MFDQLTVGSWVIVSEGCSVRRTPMQMDPLLTYVFDSGGNEFELALAPGILRRMVELSAEPPPEDDDPD
ncbi:hypothetical protein F3087_01120 [Nocardia colli]|uniref:Uncharacterized protein n=1 Tax=Nocardia colli TaxID=2545717 RepID=A0A5N0EPJ0_9NOCA|nr:hypothetical protein [Nocardia colli]KAA8889955.1 hypothetical protein F3087_01120 [Nocardia colli]